jgi:hypothetical protein
MDPDISSKRSERKSMTNAVVIVEVELSAVLIKG